MPWEAWTAIGSMLSAAVVAATVIYASRQTRLTADQLAQMRRATQFDATRTVFWEFVDPAFVDAYKFVQDDFMRLKETDAFRRDFARIGLADESVHKELIVIRALDRIGSYVRFGLVDREIIYTSAYVPRILVCYENLRDVMDIYRSIAGVTMFENFEHLYADCRRWIAERGETFDLAAVRRRMAEYQARFPASATGDPI